MAISEITRHNVYAAAMDSLGVDTRSNPKALAWAFSGGDRGEKPEGVSRIAVNLAVQTVLLAPPSWLAHELPATPAARLALLKRGES